MAWHRIFCASDANAPSRRECHSIVTADSKLVLFGGNDDAGRFREVHILDTVDMRWSRIAPDEHAPGKRSAHTANVIDGRWMYVFGGWNGSQELGECARFDLGA